MTTHTEIEPREAVRQLHVLYGIAMTCKLTEDELIICDVYGEIVRDIHHVLLGITSCNDVETELKWLVGEWEQAAHNSDARQAALFTSWAKNVRNIR